MNNQILQRSLANMIFAAHLALVCFVAVGWLVPKFFYVHLGLLIATLLSEIFLGYCLLTRLEFDLRKKLDPTLSFDKSCIVHYLRKWRGLPPRPFISKKEMPFLKRYSFILILIFLATLSLSYRFFI